MIVPVILSGGAGSRLWPLSRELHPKQFLTLVDGDTLLQNTVKRLIGISNLAAPIMVCNGEHRFMVAEQLRFIGTHPSAIVLEPEGHNTAPAITIATLQAVEKGQDPLLLVLPADHVIRNIEAFQRAVATGAVYAAQGKLITFGIIPQGPETGYGYIKQGDCLAEEEGRRCAFYVEQFVEKPDLETAQGYIDSGEYAWNSGMFMFRASRILEELER
jgi:mannose-1-phosphate guanylyltransferase/mannose-6-phosphate isomerase